MQNFFQQCNTWYEGYSIFAPSTNNALERFNRTLKSAYMQSGRKSVTSFIKKCRRILNDEAILQARRPPVFHTRDYTKSTCLSLDGFELVETTSDENCIRYAAIPLNGFEQDRINHYLEKMKLLSFTSFFEMREAL